MITREDVARVINEELYGAFPIEFGEISRNRQSMDSYVSKILETCQRRGFTYTDLRDGARALTEGDEGNYRITISKIVKYAEIEKKKRERRDGTGKRRIITPEEESYEMYLEEMKKPPQKRNEWLIRRLLPSCEIFTNPEAFKRKYGKYREEFEKY